MRHFAHLTARQRAAVFAVPPRPFDRSAPRSVLALGLGATLYSPGTREDLVADSLRAASIGTTSHVWCLEDAIPHEAVPAAQAAVVTALRSIEGGERLPLLFVRVRTPEMITEITRAAGDSAARLCGFVLPKFTGGEAGTAWMQAVEQASTALGQTLWAMPVLEHEDLAWRETRAEHLAGVSEVVAAHDDHVLAMRVGGTDLCGLFGLRRDVETTIWDVAVVRDVLADILNVFARRGRHVVTGPVWEHFSGGDRLFRSQLRSTPFEESGSSLRPLLVRDDVDELLREVMLDRANGLTGKTVIHPTHVSVVNALLAVARDEYDDALTVLASAGTGGVVRSPSGGRMNELGPHALWAEQVLARAGVYGVLAEPGGVVTLLDAGWRAVRAAYGLPTRAAPQPTPAP